MGFIFSVLLYLLSTVYFVRFIIAYRERANSVSYSAMAGSKTQPHLRVETDELLSLLKHTNSLLSDVYPPNTMLLVYKSLSPFSLFSPFYSFQ